MNKKRISIFGATGSVGQNTLDLISRDRDSYEIVVLTAGSNIDLLIKAALEFKPQAVVAATNDQFEELKNALRNTQINIGTGREALLESASRKCDLAFSAIVGAAGLEPGLIHLMRKQRADDPDRDGHEDKRYRGAKNRSGAGGSNRRNPRRTRKLR